MQEISQTPERWYSTKEICALDEGGYFEDVVGPLGLPSDFVEKSEWALWFVFTHRTIFENSKNIYALHVTGTSLIKVMTDYWNNYDIDQKLRIRMTA